MNVVQIAHLGSFSFLSHAVGEEVSLDKLVAAPEDEGAGTDAEAVVCALSRDSVQHEQAVMGQLGKSHKMMQAMEEFQVSKHP